MSRIRHELSVVQFQIENRQASASMEALRATANDLNKSITTTEASIKALGNVPVDDANLVSYQKTLSELKRDLNDVARAQNELMKGAKAADKLWKAAATGTMESLSMKEIKAGQRGMQARMQNLQPSKENEAMLRAMKAAIEEGDIAIRKFESDTAHLIQTVNNGGAVSKNVLSKAKSDLAGLLDMLPHGTKEWSTYAKQLKVVEGELDRLTQAEQKAAQADQTTLMNKRMKSLKDLSASALAETRRYWEQMVANAANGSAELAKYEDNLKKVINQERARTKAGAESVLGNMDKYGVDQVRNAVQEMTRLRDSVQQGIPMWQHYNNLVKEGEVYLSEYAEREKIARGEAISLSDALKLSSTAGSRGFSGTFAQLQQAEATLQKALQTAQKGSAEWERYRDALSKVRMEMQNAGMTTERMQAILDFPKGKSFNELKLAIEQGRRALADMRTETEEGKRNFDELAKKVQAADFEMKQLGNSSKGTATSFDKAWSRLQTYIGLYMGAAVAIQKLVGTLGDLMELSDKMGEVRKTTGFTAYEVGRLSDNLAKLDTRTSITSLMELGSLAGSVGLKTQQDIQGFVEAADQLIVALPEMGNESARTLIKIATATGDLKKNNNDVRETLEKVGSTIIALRANSASAAGPITDFVSRVGAVGAQAGISIDQIAALGSTIDALGGRVEMSATALSRMIPAIRNNAFGVANAIGVPQKQLEDLFNQGKAMEAMVLIFEKMRNSVQGFDTSTEEGMSAMAKNVEDLLGKNATMKEVMSQLNQQGARAGIVFGLLSQNVDELKKQLGIAGEAYRDNTALLNEYNNMSETAAAKWARLKNQLEEMFVSNTGQRWLGDIIDGLRKIVDLISMDGPMGTAIRSMIGLYLLWKTKWLEAIGDGLTAMGKYLISLKSSTVATAADTAAKTTNAAATTAVGTASEGAAVKTGLLARAWGGLNKAMRANLIGIAATALTVLAFKLYDAAKEAKEASKHINAVADAEKKAKEESKDQRAELEKLYSATKDQTKSLEERKKALRDMVGDEKYHKYYENLANESDLAKAAAGAYKELAAEIMATARARALEAKAKELYENRIELENQRDERRKWMKENEAAYRKAQEEYDQQVGYVAGATGGASSGFQESQVARAAIAKRKPAIIDEYAAAEVKIGDISDEISQIDEGIKRLEAQINTVKPQGTEGSSGGSGNGAGGTDTPYGDFNRVTSPYEEWDADSLVSRRKEMLERVRALANGADVQRVLSEDAKFITEATRNNIKTTKQAIEWYNTERLKIQEALHERYLTNTGDWKDPEKGGKKASKMVQDEMKYYLDELDAYYTERKTRIQAAATEEGVTEAEVRNRTLANEMEWRQRRAELQRLYAKKSEQVTQEEQNAIFNILSERTGETNEYIQKDVEQTVKFIEKVGKEKGKPAMDKILGDLDLAIERDFLKQQQAVTTQMRAIQDIIDKERPFNGITKNLRDNLVTMGILTADMMEERNRLMKENADMSDFNSRQSAEEMKRTAFLLGEAESAYNTTIEDVMRRMADSGMQAWADEMQKSPKMQQELMAQLRSTFDKVHEAVKKEASLLKKEAENMWNNILMPDGETTAKQFADRAVAALSMNENRVNRANQLVGAGQASERVADKLAIKQMQIQLTLREHYYNLMRSRGQAAVDKLKEEAEAAKALNNQHEYEQKILDAKHAQMALNLATAKEETELAKQRESIMARTEDSQNRLYKELRSWVSLLDSSLTSVFEAMNTGNAEYYNERAKLELQAREPGVEGKDLTEKGTYVVIENAGEDDATAHYEYLTELEYLNRQHEIEQSNATKDAIKKMLDDINMKFSETITDQMNAMLQDAAVRENMEATLRNTDAEKANTEALLGLTGALNNLSGTTEGGGATDSGGAKQNTSVPTQEAPEGADGKKKPTATVETGPLTGGIIREGDMGVGEDGVPEELRRPEDGGGEGYVFQPSWVRTEEEAKQAVTNTQAVYDDITEIEGEYAKTMAELQQELGYHPPVIPSSEKEAGDMADNYAALTDSMGQSVVDMNQNVSDAVSEMSNPVNIPAFTTPAQLDAAKANLEEYGETYTNTTLAIQEAVQPVAPDGGGAPAGGGTLPLQPMSEDVVSNSIAQINQQADAEIAAANKVTNTLTKNNEKELKSSTQADQKEKASANAKFAAMTMASQMYGIAYQTMSNDNLTATQKFASMALQIVGQMVINMMTTDMLKADADGKVKLPGIFGKAVESLGPIAGPIAFAGMTALLGGLMGMASSAVTKSKSEVAQVTGASSGGAVAASTSSIKVGRLATGMQTYAEGNVNEFTDPASLTSGRYYNVDGADGKTHRAKYMGKGAKTHITSGPEFHLVGEAGREAIIDAHTTRNIQMNEPEIWRSIQTLYNGGSLSHIPRKRSGMPAFADGNIDDFDGEVSGNISPVVSSGMSTEQILMLQQSLDRNSAVLERALTEGIPGVFNVYGPDGLVDAYDTAKRTLNRHGERR